MLEKELDLLLQKRSYQRLALNTPAIRVYARPVEGRCYAVVYYPEDAAKTITSQSQEHIVRNVRQYFYDSGYVGLEVLSLVETEEPARIKTAFGTYENVWFLDGRAGRLVLYEGQEDFDGLRAGLEDILCMPQENMRGEKGKYFAVSPCNTLLVAANILIFLLCEIFGSTLDTGFLLAHGALNYQMVVGAGEYYRLFTYMFLHGGIQHLFNNMLILWFLGDNLERQMGHVKYLILYFVSGILAGLASMSYNESIGRFVICVGASGAIFGVSGALAYIVLVNRGHVENLTVRQMLLFIALSLYGGFSSQGVDNVAHVGGLVAGVCLALLLYRKKRAGSEPTAEKRLD